MGNHPNYSPHVYEMDWMHKMDSQHLTREIVSYPTRIGSDRKAPKLSRILTEIKLSHGCASVLWHKLRKKCKIREFSSFRGHWLSLNQHGSWKSCWNLDSVLKQYPASAEAIFIPHRLVSVGSASVPHKNHEVRRLRHGQRLFYILNLELVMRSPDTSVALTSGWNCKPVCRNLIILRANKAWPVSSYNVLLLDFSIDDSQSKHTRLKLISFPQWVS